MSNADELLKLNELLNKQAITQAEYERMKSELLGKGYAINTGMNNNVNNYNSVNKKKSHGCLMTIIILIVAFILFGKLVIESSNERFYNNQQAIEGIVTSYEDFSSIIEQCGFSNYSLERDEILDEIEGEGTVGVRIKMPKLNGIIYIKDGAIYSVKYADNYLYRDGKIQHTLSEYIVTNDEAEALILKTQGTISGILKSPTTAKYPLYNEWRVGKRDGSTIVQGYVDSQNGFGAMIRSTFQVTYTNNVITSLIFDGEEYIK